MIVDCRQRQKDCRRGIASAEGAAAHRDCHSCRGLLLAAHTADSCHSAGPVTADQATAAAASLAVVRSPGYRRVMPPSDMADRVARATWTD